MELGQTRFNWIRNLPRQRVDMIRTDPDIVIYNEKTTFFLLLHRPWGSGEPNNHRDSEDCAEIWDNLLNDKNCEQPLQFICERPKGKLT